MEYKNKNGFTPAFKNVEEFNRCIMNSCDGCCLETVHPYCEGKDKSWTDEHPEIKLIAPSEIKDYWTNYEKKELKGMRFYIMKAGKESAIIYKEKLWQSVVSDLLSMLVIVVLFACDILFSRFVERSFVFDVFVCLALVVYVTYSFGRRRISKRDVSREVDEFINS